MHMHVCAALPVPAPLWACVCVRIHTPPCEQVNLPQGYRTHAMQQILRPTAAAAAAAAAALASEAAAAAAAAAAAG